MTTFKTIPSKDEYLKKLYIHFDQRCKDVHCKVIILIGYIVDISKKCCFPSSIEFQLLTNLTFISFLAHELVGPIKNFFYICLVCYACLFVFFANKPFLIFLNSNT